VTEETGPGRDTGPLWRNGKGYEEPIQEFSIETRTSAQVEICYFQSFVFSDFRV